ncbi:MAG: PAS domain-containing protein, partial [Planctomycetaceae bacterium]
MKPILTDLSCALIEMSQDALLLVSRGGQHIDYVNPAAETLLGLKAAQVQSIPLDSFLQHDKAETGQSSQLTAPGWTPQIVSSQQNLSHGVWVRRVPVEDEDTVRELIMIRPREMMRVAGIPNDIAHPGNKEDKPRRQLNDLAHLLRLTTMGEMVAGLTHELNQPLAAITNFAVA